MVSLANVGSGVRTESSSKLRCITNYSNELANEGTTEVLKTNQGAKSKKKKCHENKEMASLCKIAQGVRTEPS